MGKGFKKIRPQEMKDNPFQAIGADWMLIAAGTPKKFNMMTAGWGAFGVLWGKNVCFCFVRPQRYTYEFMERSEFFSLSFFDKKHKKALNICGTKSGRDIDKAKAAGLTVLPVGEDAVAFEEARLVIVLRKIYFQDIDPARFLDDSIHELYPQKDYHRMYAGEITDVLLRK